MAVVGVVPRTAAELQVPAPLADLPPKLLVQERLAMARFPVLLMLSALCRCSRPSGTWVPGLRR
jgi:hypothetical protein